MMGGRPRWWTDLPKGVSWQRGPWDFLLQSSERFRSSLRLDGPGPPKRYLEAVENGNVDLHQRLVLPQGGRLPRVQVHLLGHFL